MKQSQFVQDFVFVIRVFLLISLVFCQFGLALPAAFAEGATYGSIYVNLAANSVEGYGWPLDDVVTLIVHDPSTPSSSDIILTNTSHQYDLTGKINLKPGLVLTMTDGTATQTMTIVNLQVTSVDPTTDSVSGIAPAGMQVDVGTADGSHAKRHTIADADGNWSVKFSVVGTQWDEQTTTKFLGGTSGIVEVDNDGNSTSTWWRMMLPYIVVYTFSRSLLAYDWPLGALLTVTISGSSVNYTMQVQKLTDFRKNVPILATLAKINLPDDTTSLQAGNVITITDGINSKSYTISPLQVKNVDLQADTISGIANPGVQVEVWLAPDSPASEQCFAIRITTADELGNWTANFQIPGASTDETCTVDIQADDFGQASETNSAGYKNQDNGDATWVGWWSTFINEPPVITAITAPVTPVQLGQSINATIEFSDPDVNDTHTVTWDWGDGSTTTAAATTSHTYTSTGVYTITATVTDAAGESDTEVFQYVVIYDPNGGYVTGGGWINSPVGAYTADPTLTGKATFGFVSKYQKGANVPTGNTEFQFKVADLSFKSTSYDWLVIAGSKAQYKGTGTINGTGEYKFILTAIDGTLDKFRIKIWDTATGDIVYDNMHGMADSADPTISLGGGSIVIHKEK
jgi:hypothetical protein